MNVTLEDAYAEACKALGEAQVTQRLMAAELARVSGELAALQAEPPPMSPRPTPSRDD